MASKEKLKTRFYHQVYVCCLVNNEKRFPIITTAFPKPQYCVWILTGCLQTCRSKQSPIMINC
nr:MAG TPA: hypothetical protein [Caudoviricetes sp.]